MPNDHDELVDVFDTQQETEALIIQGLLESAGIESLITAHDAPQDVLPGVGGVVVRVRPDLANKARAMISDYRSDNTPVTSSDSDSDTEGPDSAS